MPDHATAMIAVDNIVGGNDDDPAANLRMAYVFDEATGELHGARP